MLKNIRKNLDFVAAGCIFAASNLHSGPNAAVLLRPAFFVATPYRNISTTTPCRESGNRPGALASKSQTARSVVFLCLKITSMTTRTFFGLRSLASEWLGGECRLFTALCGERVTRGEVLLTAAGVCLLLLAVGSVETVATWVAGGAR